MPDEAKEDKTRAHTLKHTAPERRSTALSLSARSEQPSRSSTSCLASVESNVLLASVDVFVVLEGAVAPGSLLGATVPVAVPVALMCRRRGKAHPDVANGVARQLQDKYK